MKKKVRKRKMSDKEIAAYYDAQSEDEVVREIKSGNWLPSDLKVKRSQTRATSVRLAAETIHSIKALAAAKGIGFQTLLRIWIEERARKEARLS